MAKTARVPIQVTIHEEDGVWWAESSALPGFSAAADSREELIARCEAVRLEGAFTFVGPWKYTRGATGPQAENES